MLEVDFPSKETNVVSMEFWINPTSIKSYKFLNEYNKKLKEFQGKVVFTPKYKFKNLKNEFEQEFLEKHCYGRGEFCSIDTLYMDSKSILEEGLR